MIRVLILLVALLSVSATLQAVPAFVQGTICKDISSSATTDCVFPGSVTSGNQIIAFGRWDTGVNTENITMSIASGATCGTWTTRNPLTSGGEASGTIHFRMFGAECQATSSGAQTVRMTVSNTVPFRELSIMEYSPTAGSTLVFDVAAQVTNIALPASTACSSGATATLATSAELAIGYCAVWNLSISPWNSVSGWTNRASATNIDTGIYDKVTASTSGVSFDYTLPSADEWGAMVMVFRETGGGGGGSPVIRRRPISQ